MMFTSICEGAADRLMNALEATVNDCKPSCENGLQLIAQTLREGCTIYACGNGGSSSSAAHFIAELVGRYKLERGPLRAVALGSCLSTVTAIGNDYGYDQIFSRELEGLGRAGDTLVCLTTSGKSPNVLTALASARELGIRTIVLTGEGGASVTADCVVAVPSSETARIQEVHDFIIHIWCEALDALLTQGDS